MEKNAFWEAGWQAKPVKIQRKLHDLLLFALYLDRNGFSVVSV
jgi:hypothetical protein